MYMPIKANGYSGDAMVRSGQPISTISQELIGGLELMHYHVDCCLAAAAEKRNTKSHRGRKSQCCPPDCEECIQAAVEVPIILGTRNAIIKQKMFILEDIAPYLYTKWPFASDEPPTLPLVILGKNFIDKSRSLISRSGVDFIESKLFGYIRFVPEGLNQPFSRIDNNYEHLFNNSVSAINFRTTNYGNDPCEDNRIILLFDLDCFEVQVHEEPWMRGKPRVVVNSSGRITAVSYEAKQLGINRESTPYFAQAEAKYKKVIKIEIPIREGVFNRGPPRPDGSHAREASARIVAAIKTVLSRYEEDLTIFEFSSGDEFFVDVTKLVDCEMQTHAFPAPSSLWPNTFLFNATVTGNPTPEYVRNRLNRLANKKNMLPYDDQELRLLVGSKFANIIIREILDQTGFQSSVGIGANKLVAKIASGIHKPGSVTIFAPSGFDNFSRIVDIRDIPGLGGKTGEAIKEKFNAQTMYDLRHVQAKNLAQCPIDGGRRIGREKAEEFLNKANGLCCDPVVDSVWYKTSGVTRNLFGKQYNCEDMKDILNDQCQELFDKLEFEKRENDRRPVKIKMTFTCRNKDNIHSTILTDCGRRYKPKELYKMFIRNCDMPFWEWNSSTGLDECRLIANF